ncbi:MAG: hypothetical protein DRO87_12425 [Candidatus Thorarchaeota archaeon]|nr:MAG: hypothetical protein DRO87_12425 [Candidatus Thorarchaeota archaeon]
MRFIIGLLIALSLCSCTKRVDFVPMIDAQATRMNGKKPSLEQFKKEVVHCQEYAKDEINRFKIYFYGGIAADVLDVATQALMGTLIYDADYLDEMFLINTGMSSIAAGMDIYQLIRNRPELVQEALIVKCLIDLGYVIKGVSNTKMPKINVTKMKE